MPWVHFNKDFDWRFGRSTMRSFVAGQTVMVTTECAKKAKASEAGHVVSKPAHLKTTKAGQTVNIND